MPVWNQLPLTRDCIEHIVKNTRHPFRLIIIDNGSERETQEYLKELENNNKGAMTLIRNEANLGFVKAVNQGLQISQAPYICLLNNDVLVSEGWLTEMIKLADSDAKIGIVNPQSEEADCESIDEYLKNKSEGLSSRQGQFIEIMGAMGFCMLIKREASSKIGLLDEAFGIGGYDDMDYSRRAWQLGYRCVKAKGAYVIHRVHSSFDRFGKKKKRQIGRETRALFWKKWGRIPRVAFILTKPLNDQGLFDQVYSQAHNLARDWNMVYCFLKDSAASFQIRHQSIRLIRYPDRFFLLRCLGQILKPKKKRLRYMSVFVDDPGFARFLRIISFVHWAKIVLI